MANPKKIEKVKLDVIKAPANLVFGENMFRKDSVYGMKLLEALRTDSVVRVMATDNYTIGQFRTRAKTLGLRLVFAKDDTYVYIRPIQLNEDHRKLLLLLREPRSMMELESKHLEMNLKAELDGYIAKGLIKVVAGKYAVTTQGAAFIDKQV